MSDRFPNICVACHTNSETCCQYVESDNSASGICQCGHRLNQHIAPGTFISPSYFYINHILIHYI